MHAVTAKVNKCILRDRGFFMKFRSESFDTNGSGVCDRVDLWYEIALTPGETKRLEAQTSYPAVGGIFDPAECCPWLCPNENDYVTEFAVDDDPQFRQRWPTKPENNGGVFPMTQQADAGAEAEGAATIVNAVIVKETMNR